MYLRILFVLISLGNALPVWADHFTLDPTHTFPSFEVDHLGISTQRGRFNSTQGKLTLDLDRKTGAVEISINAASIDTGFDKLEDKLRSEEYFDVKRYPNLVFSGNKFRFEDERLVAVSGKLTLHGVTQPVTLSVSRFKCGINVVRLRYVCGADLATQIKRSEFDMGKGTPFVGDEVNIMIQVEAARD